MSSVYFFLCPWEGFPRQTCNNHLRRKQGCELMDQIQTVVWQFFCASLGRSLCHGNEHCGIDPNMSNSAHHDCSTQAVFLCTADKLQYWPMLARWTLHAQPSPPFIQHLFEQRLQLFYQVLLFENNPWAGLGRILAVACATTEKHWCPVSTFSYFHGKAFLGKPAAITFGENKDVNSWIMTVPERLSFSAQLTHCNVGPCWHGMAHIGACWHSAFSTFHSLGQ